MNQHSIFYILLILCCFIPLHSYADTGGTEVEHTSLDSLTAQDLADLTNGEFEELFTQMTVEEAEALAKQEEENTQATANKAKESQNDTAQTPKKSSANIPSPKENETKTNIPNQPEPAVKDNKVDKVPTNNAGLQVNPKKAAATDTVATKDGSPELSPEEKKSKFKKLLNDRAILTISSPRVGKITIDGKYNGAVLTKKSRKILLKPGVHDVKITYQEGKPERYRVKLAAGKIHRIKGGRAVKRKNKVMNSNLQKQLKQKRKQQLLKSKK